MKNNTTTSAKRHKAASCAVPQSILNGVYVLMNVTAQYFILIYAISQKETASPSVANCRHSTIAMMDAIYVTK